MEKLLCWGSMGVAVLLLVLFGLDLATGMLFRGIGTVVDIISILCCALLGYLAWDALRDIR